MHTAALSGVAVGTTVGAHVMEVRSAEDVRMLAKAAFEPAALALRQRFAPLKDWSQVSDPTLGCEVLYCCVVT